MTVVKPPDQTAAEDSTRGLEGDSVNYSNLEVPRRAGVAE